MIVVWVPWPRGALPDGDPEPSCNANVNTVPALRTATATPTTTVAGRRSTGPLRSILGVVSFGFFVFGFIVIG